MTLRISPVTPADYDAVATVAIDAYVGGGFVSADSPYVDVLSDTAARAESSIILVARRSNEVVGSITLAPAGSSFAEFAPDGALEVRVLSVARSVQGLGVAHELLRASVETARDRGETRLVLRSAEDLIPAHKLYAKFGFRRLPGFDSVLDDGRQQPAFDYAVVGASEFADPRQTSRVVAR